MDKKTLKDCILKLEQLKKQNLESVSNLSISLENMESSIDSGDEMDYSTNLSELTRLRTLKKQLEMKGLQIKSAEQRIEKGLFGICSSCEDEIPKKRLLANPLSIRCLSCQEDKEQIDKENKMRSSKGAVEESASDED